MIYQDRSVALDIMSYGYSTPSSDKNVGRLQQDTRCLRSVDSSWCYTYRGEKFFQSCTTLCLWVPSSSSGAVAFGRQIKITVLGLYSKCCLIAAGSSCHIIMP